MSRPRQSPAAIARTPLDWARVAERWLVDHGQPITPDATAFLATLFGDAQRAAQDPRARSAWARVR